MEQNEFENLVGNRSQDDKEKEQDDVNTEGQPLYMAFLADPEAVNVTKEEIQDAKNALLELQNQHPEVVSLCRHRSIPECLEAVRQVA